MRTALIETLLELAQEDDRITLITGDLGFGVVEPFMDKIPDQFVNAGVAEQNMTGLATGMALSGRIVFTYSIGNFPTIRCLEQVRNDVCYHNADVKIVSVGGGMSYGPLGMSHHATEDLAVMRVLPNMVVVAPADPIEARHATRAVVKHSGPCYVRLGRSGEPNIHASLDIDFELGRAITVRDGKDVTLIAIGPLLGNVLEAAQLLEAGGISAQVLSMHTLKPLDGGAVLAAAAKTGAILTFEEHNVIGGLGGAVAEILLETHEALPLFKRVGIPDCFASIVGEQDHLRARYGLDVAGISKTVEGVLEGAENSPRSKSIRKTS